MSRLRSVLRAPRWLVGAVLGVALLPGCANLSRPAPDSIGPSPTAAGHIVIFHSNDVHAKIDNFAKIAALIAAEKSLGGDVYYFSAGDNFTGAPVVDKYDPPGEPIIELLARLGCDVMTLGNHEFDYGLETVARLTSRFRTVSANIEAPPGLLPGLKPWVTLTTRTGIIIVVFGLIQVEPDNGIPSTHPDRVKGLRFSEPLAKARELRKLRGLGHVLIALTHIGHEPDLLLAKEMPEIDAIIGSHSHTRVERPEKVSGVFITQAGSDNMFLGRIDLEVKDGRVVDKKSRLIDLSKEKAEDPAIKDLIAGYYRNPSLARVIAKAPLEIAGKETLGSLMTDASRQVHGFDIAFQNNGGIRLNRLPRSITLNDIYTLDPFGNLVVEFILTPAEIRSLIKASFEKRNDIDLQVSGMTYVVRVDAALQIKDIRLSGPDGSPLDEGRTYKVGLSSYIASSYRFAHDDPGRSLGTTAADDLIRFLESGPDLSVYREVRRAFLEKDPPASPD